MSFLIGDNKSFSQVIAENLNTAVVSDINTLAKSIRDDRRKVSPAQSSTKTFNLDLTIGRIQEYYLCNSKAWGLVFFLLNTLMKMNLRQKIS